MKAEATELVARYAPGITTAVGTLATTWHFVVDALPILISICTFLLVSTQAYVSTRKAIKVFKSGDVEVKDD